MNIKNTITSIENPLIKETKKLKDKKYRNERGQFLVEGFRFVEEAIKSSFVVEAIFVDKAAFSKLEQSAYLELIVQVPIYILEERVLKQLSATEHTQGIVALVNMKKEALRVEKGFYVLIDRLQDPGNLGTIIRTSHAAGAKAVLITQETCDIYNEKTLRATMGSLFYIPVHKISYEEVMQMREKGFKLVVSSLKGDKNFYEEALLGNIIVAIGSEASGVGKEVQHMADILVKLPMPGGAESLNAAVAGSIMIYEVLRQNKEA